jgi:hypothetical protein
MGFNMVDFLSKISSYDLFNYLLTGIIFVILADKLTCYSFIQQDIAIGLFLYYFIGLVISRIGSLVIEPFLKSRRISFLKFEPYEKFLAASEKDKKIELLSQVNNTYRTFCSVFAILFLLKLYEGIQSRFPFLKDWDLTLLVAFLFVVFLFAYRKQTGFLTDRIKDKVG